MKHLIAGFAVMSLLIGSAAIAAAPAWPCDTTNLVFLWGPGRNQTLAFDVTGEEKPTYEPIARGFARFGRNRLLIVQGGSYDLQDANPYILAQCQQKKALTFESYLTFPESMPTSPVVVLAVASGDTNFAFTICQARERLWLTMSVPGGGDAERKIDLGPVPSGKTNDAGRARHVIVSWMPSRLACYINGERQLMTMSQGARRVATKAAITLGSDADGGANWGGALEGVAIYARFIDDDEAKQHAETYAKLVAARPAVPKLVLEGKLLRHAPAPDREQMGQYFRALSEYLYEVDTVISGSYDQKLIRVLHWTVFEDGAISIGQRPVDKVYRLELESWADNPQIEPEFTKPLVPQLKQELYYDIGPVVK